MYSSVLSSTLFQMILLSVVLFVSSGVSYQRIITSVNQNDDVFIRITFISFSAAAEVLILNAVIL